MIRELRKEDKKKFVSMVKDFYESEAVLHNIPVKNILNTYNEAVSGSPYIKAYIVEEEKEIAGYGLVSLTYSNEVGGLVVWIEELYILEEYRGLGLGNELLDFIEEKFSSNAKRFRLEVSKTNKSVQNLYIQKGFSSLEYLQMVNDL